MHGFSYKNGSLFCENVELKALAEEHGTPLYVYSAGTILDHFNRLDSALAEVNHEVAFAVKANSMRSQRMAGSERDGSAAGGWLG